MRDAAEIRPGCARDRDAASRRSPGAGHESDHVFEIKEKFASDPPYVAYVTLPEDLGEGRRTATRVRRRLRARLDAASATWRNPPPPPRGR